MSAPTTVAEIKDGEITKYEIKPEDFGFERCSKEDLVGGGPEENAQITRDILSGKIKEAKRNAVVLNAAACIYIADKADSIADGIKVAEDVIDSGKAAETLDAFVRLTNE